MTLPLYAPAGAPHPAARPTFFKRATIYAAMALIIGGVLWYSRLILLVRPTSASLGTVVLFGALFIGVLVRDRFAYLASYLFMGYSLALIVIWMLSFSLNTGLVGDWRTIVNLCGIFTFFASLYLISELGPKRFLKFLYTVCIVYVLIYAVLAFMIGTLHMFPNAPLNSVILQDPSRGRRLYPMTALIAFALLYQIAHLRSGRKPITSLLLLALTLWAIYQTGSRLGTLFSAVAVVLLLINSARLTVLFGSGYILSYFLVSITVAFFPGIVSGLLESLHDSTLSLRILSIETANNTFAAHPIFGLGLPGDASFFYYYFGFLFFPDDLGPLGVTGAYGIIGLLWMLSLQTIVLMAVRRCVAEQGPEFRSVAYAGVFVLLTTIGSPNIFQGDGGLIFGALFALLTYARRRSIVAKQVVRPVRS